MQPERSHTPEEDDTRSDWGVLVLLIHRTVDALVFPTRVALHYHAIRR
jgi:hypothetical protein